MSAIGPDLPPHLLAKRKRRLEEEVKIASSPASGAKSPDEPGKRRKVIGPAPPPAPLEEIPNAPAHTAEEQSSDDDDDFGPALPAEDAVMQTRKTENNDEDEATSRGQAPTTAEKPRRDEWMMIPPKQDDLAARMDPTRQRPKAFNTGKGARGANNVGEEDGSAWHETPEQKRKRLQDEVLGIGKPSTSRQANSSRGPRRAEEEQSSNRQIQEHLEKARGPSLLERHRAVKGKEAEDDPSKRAFDREKDMASGAGISGAQKSDMLNKAADFTSKFSGGSYL